MKARKAYPAIGVIGFVFELGLLIGAPFMGISDTQVEQISTNAPVVAGAILSYLGVTGGLSGWSAHRHNARKIAKEVNQVIHKGDLKYESATPNEP